MHGFTDNYIRVKAPEQLDLVNELVEVDMTSQNAEGLMESSVLEVQSA